MAQPLISRDQVIARLLATIPKTNPRIEVSDEYPSDDAIVGYGLFVSDVSTVDKSPYKLGVQYGGAIYVATDELQILYVSYQSDKYVPEVTDAIQNLSSDLTLMNGYHEMDYTQDVILGQRAEKRTYTFSLKRLEFI